MYDIYEYKRKEGFSLVELLVIMGILSIILVIAMPYFYEYEANNSLTSAARDIEADFAESKEKTISENLPYRITFNVSSNNYTIEQPAGTILQTKTPSTFGIGINFASSIPAACFSGASTSFNVTTVDFQTRGIMNPSSGTVLLTNRRGSNATISYYVSGKTIVCFHMQ